MSFISRSLNCALALRHFLTRILILLPSLILGLASWSFAIYFSLKVFKIVRFSSLLSAQNDLKMRIFSNLAWSSSSVLLMSYWLFFIILGMVVTSSRVILALTISMISAFFNILATSLISP